MRQPHAVPDHELADRGAVCAQGHADAHLLGALLDGVGHQPVNADGGQDQRDGAEDGEQQHVEAFARGGAPHHLVHGSHVRYGKASAGLAQLLGDGCDGLVRVSMGPHQPPQRLDARVERGHTIGDLRLRNDHHRAGIAVKAAVVGVGDDADDLPRRLLELRPDIFADDHLLTDGILLGPELFGHGLIDEHYAGRARRYRFR